MCSFTVLGLFSGPSGRCVVSGIPVRFMRAPSHVLVILLCSAFGAFLLHACLVFFPPSFSFSFRFIFVIFRCYLLSSFCTGLPVSVWRVLGRGLDLTGGACGWVSGRVSVWVVLPSWGWVGSTSRPKFLGAQPPFATLALTYSKHECIDFLDMHIKYEIESFYLYFLFQGSRGAAGERGGPGARVGILSDWIHFLF